MLLPLESCAEAERGHEGLLRSAEARKGRLRCRLRTLSAASVVSESAGEAEDRLRLAIGSVCGVGFGR